MGDSEHSRPGEPVTQGEGAEGFPHGSKYPFIVAVGAFFLGVGGSLWGAALIAGVPIFAWGVFGWAYEYGVEEFERGVIPEQKRQRLGFKSGYLAALIVILGELIVFMALFVAWFYLSAVAGPFPPEGMPAPKLWLGLAMLATMVVGSVGIGGARYAIARDHRSRFNIGVAVTMLAGLAFLGLLWVDWSTLMAHGVDWTTGAYGAAYFVVTGTHAAHLLAGMIWLGFLGYRAWGRGHFSSTRHLMVKTFEGYWYFLAFVSLLIFAFVYFPMG